VSPDIPITFHVPINEIKTSSDDSKKIFRLELLWINRKEEHVHWGLLEKKGNPEEDKLFYKPEGA
jgi:hypothetical protein